MRQMSFLVLGLLVVGCQPHFDTETVTGKSGRDFEVISDEELPNFRGHCALKISYLTKEAEPANLINDASELLEEYWGDKRASQCGVMVIESNEVRPRVGGLWYQTMTYRVVFDTDGASHWRRAPER